MGINRWRYVAYTDDGCNDYQCLKCGGRWEARTSPRDSWKFCPICGIEWSGEQAWGDPRHRDLRDEAAGRGWEQRDRYRREATCRVVIQEYHVRRWWRDHPGLMDAARWRDCCDWHSREHSPRKIAGELNHLRLINSVEPRSGDEHLFRLIVRRDGQPDRAIPWRTTSVKHKPRRWDHDGDD